MINSFKTYLVEEEKTVYFTFGRMNPPTIGHEKLLNSLSSRAGNNPYRIFLSQSQDKNKNPLSYKDKVKMRDPSAFQLVHRCSYHAIASELQALPRGLAN